MHSIVTEDADKQHEETRIREALSTCGYPDWTIKKVKRQMEDKKNQPSKERKKKDGVKTIGMVVVPYVQGISEWIQRIYKKYHDINTAIKPHNTLRRLLVHL